MPNLFISMPKTISPSSRFMFFASRLQSLNLAVQSISLPGQSSAEIRDQVDLETKTVHELIDLNIWEYKGANGTALPPTFVKRSGIKTGISDAGNIQKSSVKKALLQQSPSRVGSEEAAITESSVHAGCHHRRFSLHDRKKKT